MWCCALLVLFLFDSLVFANASNCGSITSECQYGRFLELLPKTDIQISLGLTAEPQTTTYTHQPCQGTTEPNEHVTENAQALTVRVSRKAHPTSLRSISHKENSAITSLLTSIVIRELSHCELVLLWDETYAHTSLVENLVHLPNPKQVVEVLGGREIGRLLWGEGKCKGYLLLLTDSSPLMHLADHTPHDAWDYSGRFVVAGISRAQLEAFAHTRKGRKTEHIVGIVQSQEGGYTVFINLLYHKQRLSRVFTWCHLPLRPRPTGISTQTNTPSSRPLSDAVFPTELFPDKIKNLQGAVLNVGTFNFPPAVIYRPGRNSAEGQWYGDNIFLAEAVADALNFSLRYKRPPTGEFWGKLTPNGTWDGLVGMLANGEADIVLANLFVADVKGRTEFQEYTSPHGQVESCFMVKKPSPSPRWQSIALPYTLEVWLAVLGVTVLAGPLLHVLARSSAIREADRLARHSLSYLSLYTLAMHLRISQPVVPIRTSLQVFVVFLWVHVIIVTVAYSANLTAFLTVERIPEGITSLKQLYDSKLFVYGIGGPFFADNMAESGNEYVRGLVSRFVPMPSSEAIYDQVMRGRGVHIDALNHLSYVKSLYTDLRGSSTLRIIQECFQPYSVAMGVQSHSPLMRNFNIVIKWVFEGGLVNRWFEETLSLVKKYKREDFGSLGEEGNGESEDRSKTISLTMEHLQGVFVILFLGYGTSILYFLAESLVKQKRKN